ncbi:hypothetical protein J40TS1_34090 [Paenibacillus montaniterrae]|uniref:HK97 gp10 family phage protein n=1 Tax=Paenibacillus montaniterrae TaxID=429341 RepID=A0A920CV61_9BACL|nr:HK97 gp10 family phage protein [Paenibacillus montaniterrae]GIP17767.1 hypothetical protein J40TS1_34090 [Paenibacillus montaniterrae]
MSDFDLRELDDFAKDMLEFAERTVPRETRRFLMREGNKLKNLTIKRAKLEVKQYTGNYIKGIKRGKVYIFAGDQSIRVYNSAPHAHLIEDGHRIIRNGKEVGFARGKKVFQQTEKEFEAQYVKDAEQFIDELLEEM